MTCTRQVDRNEEFLQKYFEKIFVFLKIKQESVKIPRIIF